MIHEETTRMRRPVSGGRWILGPWVVLGTGDGCGCSTRGWDAAGLRIGTWCNGRWCVEGGGGGDLLSKGRFVIVIITVIIHGLRHITWCIVTGASFPTGSHTSFVTTHTEHIVII